MNDPECIFCKIIAGEIPSEFVNEDAGHIAIRDIAAKADVHVLVIPRDHHKDLDSFVADGGSSDLLLAFARQTAEILEVTGDYRMIANVGPNAGQTVFHLHLHILSGGNLPGF